jgi:hypothetical protein
MTIRTENANEGEDWDDGYINEEGDWVDSYI